MHPFQEYLAQGQGWLFIPVAILLGALHGLEPGHSKTMMAAFIVSIRGTVAQAVLLGLSAAFSHTLVIWVLAAIGLHYAGQFDAAGLEPWFQAVTGALILAMAGWMLARLLRARRAESVHHHHHAEHDPHHGGDPHRHEERHHHDHGAGPEDFQDDHEREHARALESRFAGQPVTTAQVVLFGLTGGLMPCPAAFAVLLVCLQIRQFALGFATVLAFSVGLAVTLVTVGAVAAISLRAATRRFAGFAAFARRLPFASVALLAAVGLVLTVLGLTHIAP